ncbi:uncharacterized protein C4orf54 homolog [Antennarius striatus]|uniref:uncharacterized protein C4orf54 homolog n=1 Tax=Antennarius striatus TaxID=241820 RepID=UPI0035B435D0
MKTGETRLVKPATLTDDLEKDAPGGEDEEKHGGSKPVSEGLEDGTTGGTDPQGDRGSAERNHMSVLVDPGAHPGTEPGPDRNKTQRPKEQDAPREEDSPSSDHCSSGRSESDSEDDDDVLLLSEPEDESHYITTHEIQLSELSDHESDLGVGSSTSWDLEDDNQVYSFVDYATFDGDGASTERRPGRQPLSPGAAVSSRRESDLRDGAKFTSSDENESKAQQRGQIHLSIRTTSRAINDPSNIQEHGNILYHETRSGDMSRYVVRGVDGSAEPTCDRAKCFIAAPGRIHFGRKLKGKEVNEYSSGASSAVSDLDDADKEVRNLTARAFKSLAYPYLDAFNFSTSSESSASERGIGINRLSTFVDLKYGKMNLSQGLDPSLVSHPNSAASSQNVDSRGYQGIGLARINPPPGKIFTLNANPHGAASSTKKIELMGQFGQGHSGVIRLTETLNFRCNVQSGMSGGERRANLTQNASGSCSRDEVTNTLPGSQRTAARQPSAATMEDTHKKAIFASSLIKNVISKKMQFEQERKMERGEISEPHQAPSPGCAHQEGDGLRGKAGRELHRQSSRFSEGSADFALMCADEPGDAVQDGDSQGRDSAPAAAPTPETDSEPAEESGMEPKKGSSEASKSTLLRSQNSAFRCWKDEELEFQKDHKNRESGEKSPRTDGTEGEEDRSSPGPGKPTKMSHLFVPSIQLTSTEEDPGRQRDGGRSPGGGAEGRTLRSDNTLYVTGSRNATTSKSPEIKINLRSVRNNKTEPFGVSKMRTPNIGCNASILTRTDDLKCQALAAALKGEASDKVPHFTVRDIRDNKGKLQTPIHQVRDVRKLVKSSYHFVSLDTNESKSAADTQVEQKKQVPHRNPNSVSPIVIKCQSVNTNSNGRQPGTQPDADRASPEGAKGAPLRPAGRAPTGHPSEGDLPLRTDNMTAPKRLDKTSEVPDKKPDSKMTNQVALEKLQAAVKTMEQLYVFDRNEWKRKNDPQPLTDSHVLSLIASEEHGGSEEDGARASNRDKTPPTVGASIGTDNLLRRDDKLFQAVGGRDARLVTKSTEGAISSGSKNPVSLSSSSSAPKTAHPNAVSEAPFGAKRFVTKSPKMLSSLKNSQVKPSGCEGAGSKDSDRSTREISGTAAENENYLTIPVKSHISSNKQTSLTPQMRLETPSGQEDHSLSPKHSSIEMETCSPEIPSVTFYHSLPLAMPTNQPQVYCFSPAITPSPSLDPFQATQRKMLLDPTTGNYYLVDTPVQPATKRLFDPETGQYVDVPMPPLATTPVPVQISPMALSPAYGHSYMIYPGFMPTPSVIPARTLVQSQMSVQLEAASEEKASSQQTEGLYMESPFYMATAKSPPTASGAEQQATASKPPQVIPNVKQPVISITSQQGPRIIAPPSFDGTTMSFVVEHR